MHGVVWVKGILEPTEFQPPALSRDATPHISLLFKKAPLNHSPCKEGKPRMTR